MTKAFYSFRMHIKVCFLGFLLLPIFGYGQGLSPAIQTKLQAVLDSFQNNPANPYVGGMSAAIQIHEAAEWKGVTGFAARNFDANLLPLPGGIPFTVDHLSRIYSITKTFTAALILELVHENMLHLDDRAEKYFPLSQINPNLNNQVTIRQLLSHRSGFSDHVTNPLLAAAIANNPLKLWTPEELVGGFVTQIYPTDSVPSYASTNYVILGAIAEKVTGKLIAELYRTRFFDPLGLKSMYFPPQESIENRGMLVAPHDNLALLGPNFPSIYTNFSFFPFEGIVSTAYAGGGIVSNIEDLVKWGAALFTGRATSEAT